MSNLKQKLILLTVLTLNVFGVVGITGCQNQNDENFKFKQTDDSSVIYGEDGRKDFYENQDPKIQKIALSTVALMARENLVYDSVFDQYHFEKNNDELILCPTEKFRRQPQWAFCSGSLIAPDLILTAGHCIEDMKTCRQTQVVFDYHLSNSKDQILSMPGKNVFSCKEIIFNKVEKNGADFAIIRLDKVAEGREPLGDFKNAVSKLSGFSTEAVSYQTSLMLVGHPAGYPTKLTLNGKVRNLLPEKYFVASIDSYTGNSGSTVFDQKTLKIVGVLARGENDYVRQNSCLASKICNESECRGEDVTRISEVIKYLPK